MSQTKVKTFYIFCFYFFFVGDVTEMMITWVTTAGNISSIVEYGLAEQALKFKAVGSTATKFVDGGSEKRVLYIHRVKLTGLEPATYYGRENFSFTLESTSSRPKIDNLCRT